MTKDQKIKLMAQALIWYKNTGTRMIMIERKTGKLYAENGIIAAETLVEVGIHKKLTKKKEYL